MASARARRDPVEDLVSAFARWRPGPVDEELLGNLRLLLDVKRSYLHDDLVTWRRGDLGQLLLQICPRKVQADPELLTGGPASLGELLRYLDQSGQPRGSGLHSQLVELEEVAPQFAPAMNDTSRFGMAKALGAAMVDDGIDVTDDRAVQRWVEQFNSRPYDERAALTDGPLSASQPLDEEPDDGPVVLPPVTLLAETELRTLAEQAPMVKTVASLLAHVGPKGRPVTQTGALRLADATALAELCGDQARLAELLDRQVRRMADLPLVNEAYELAVTAELLHLTPSRVTRNLGHPAASDALLRIRALADAAMLHGVFVGADAPTYAVEDAVIVIGESLPALLGLLYGRAEPVALEEVCSLVAAELGRPGDPRAVWLEGYLATVWARFERLGVVEQLGWRVVPEREWLGERAARRATSVALTPLGVWWLQGALPSYGVRTPLVGELASVAAAELCDGLDGYPLTAVDSEIAAWCAARGEREAAGQLAALLASPDRAHRQFALHVLDGLPGAADAVREQLDDDRARPFAVLWLETHDHRVDERYRRPEDTPVLMVEMAAGLLAEGGEADLLDSINEMSGSAPLADVVRQLWRVESPATRDVLEVIAASAPGPVAKAARKALFSLHSAGR